MHKLMTYICDELDELERKADKGKLSMAELQYVDLLAHAKKNLLTADAMMDTEDNGYSGDYSYARGRGRNARRDSRGRYSNEGNYDMTNMGGSYRGGSYAREGGYSRAEAKEEIIMELHDMERNANDDESRQMIRRWIKQAEEH